MSSNMKITPLKDVKPFKTEWQLHVKVLLTWKQCTSKSGKTLDIILADENVNNYTCTSLFILYFDF